MSLRHKKRAASRQGRTTALLLSMSASAAVAAMSAPAFGSFQVTERFNSNTDGYWTNIDTRVAPQNYGWSGTDNTGNTINPPGGTASGAGEFGGQIYRPHLPATPTYYGFDIGTINPATEGFDVSGVIRSNRKDGAFFFGYFQGAFSVPDPNKNAHNFVGFLLNDGTEVFTQVFNPGGSREGTQLPGVTVPFDGTPVPFSMVYQPPPAGTGNGSLSVTVNGVSGTTNLPNTIVQSIGDLTHFGLFPQVKDPGALSYSEVYFDDLTFSSENALPVPDGSIWALDGDGDWFEPANWVGGVPNATDAKATFGDIITANRLVFANSPATVGTLKFDDGNRYMIDGLGSVNLQIASGGAVIDVVQGTHHINLPLNLASNTEIKAGSGSTLFISDPVTVNPGVAVTQTGTGTVLYESTVTVGTGATMQFGNSSHMAALTVNGNGSAEVTPGLTKVLRVDNVNVGPDGKLDLKDNKLITNTPVGVWDGTKYTGIQGEVGRAYDFGAWDLPGIMTSDPEAGPTVGRATIGVATGEQALFLAPNETGVFAGQTINGTTTIAMYTWAGDVDLNGYVDAVDYGTIDQWIQFPGTTGYTNGDLNYDGVIDAVDYGIIDNGIQLQGAPIPMNGAPIASASSGLQAVPEPASLSLIGLAATSLLSRRRRRGSTPALGT